ncbi:MAG TPA: PAS domain S-box protein, partial [Bdellovibrionota bacterium]|nr:PAS domain S-box protein [Bdellovibrionota bacterium]
MRTAKRAPHLRSVEPAVTGRPGPGPGPGLGDEYASKYQILFDQASDAILTLSSEGRIDAANQAVEEMTGYHKTELVGVEIALLVPPSEKLRGHNRARPLSSETFATPGTYEDVAMMRKDGYIRYVDVSVRHVSRGSETLAVALYRDLTEKKRMEREVITKHTELRGAYLELEKKNAELQAMQETLVQSGKMAALGELATGIAHEINQPLQGIRGYAQELQHALGEGASGETTFALKEIVSCVDKATKIIGYLRGFVRKSTEDHQETDIHVAIEEALKMLDRQFASRGIKVNREFGKDLPKVYANP